MRKRIDSTLDRLIRDGIASGQWRGHHMGPARFAGEAVALGCNRLMVVAAVKEIDAE
jgi:hypothetical protein